MLQFLQEPTDHEDISEGEEEKNNASGVTEVWTNLSPEEQSSIQANKDTQRHNPPRNRKTPDRLTY